MQPLIPRLSKPLLALLAVALCASGLCVVGADQAGAAGRYVAFGDSATTGSGLGSEYPGSRPLCWQTQVSYPVYVKSALSFSDFASAACSAAWVNDLTTTQELWNEATSQFEDTAPPQLDALNGTETLVTVAMGGNDSGYGDIVNNCLNNTTTGTPCKDQYVTNGVNYFVNRANTLMSAPLGDAIDEIHRRSPNAEVWIVGYLRLLPEQEDVSNCLGRVDISAGDAPVVEDWQRAMNKTARETAESHDAYYVDVLSQSTKHDACRPIANDRWINPGPAATPSGWSLHPTAAGHLAIANLFINAFNSPRPVRPVKSGPNGTTLIGQTLSIAFSAKKVRSATSGSAPIMTTPPKKRGAKLEVKLARSGTVEFAVDRAKAGRIKAGKCRSMSKRAGKGRKACTRYVPLQSKVILALPGGSSSVYFTGRAGGKRLAAGKYRLRAALGTLSAKTPTFKLSQ